MLSQSASSADSKTDNSRVDFLLTIAASLAVVLLIFGPLVAVAIYVSTPMDSLAARTAESTVGVGVILRAVGRRLFRAGATHTIRITFGTITRTVARTITTRLVKLFIRAAAGGIAKDLMGSDQPDASKRPSSALVAVAVGVVATGLSFFGVVALAETELLDGLNAQLHLPLAALVAGAVIPLVVFAVVGQLFARIYSAKLDLKTGIDGLLVQAYFTFSGAFLPMTTDVEFKGSPDRCAKAAAGSLATMMFLFGTLRVIGSVYKSDFSIYLSAMFLVYAFVYAFPVKPLLGNSIWSYNKGWWVLTFLPIILGFIFAFPSAVTEIL